MGKQEISDGEWLRLHRKMNCLTLKQLAERVPYTKEYIQMMETGKRRVTEEARTIINNSLKEYAKESEDELPIHNLVKVGSIFSQEGLSSAEVASKLTETLSEQV